jgi:TolB-like protein
MPLAGSENVAALRQLDRLLASPGFARNERLSRFLRFVVERRLEGRGEELKESLIGIEVFGRPPGFDSNRDSIVRTEAARLRARLNEYYLNGGSADPLVIELPKGSYVPTFRPGHAEVASAPSSRGLVLRPVAAVVAACVLAISIAAIWWWSRSRPPIAIAVLPLENLSHDPADDYFADGLTDELIRNLSIIDGLSPRSRTSSFAFKGKPRNVREVGKELSVDYVLEGSVLRDGQSLRVDADLIRVRDDSPVWSEKFDRKLTDVFAIQDEISLNVVNSLRLKLGKGRRRYETSVEAYDSYLRARALETQSGSAAGNCRGCELRGYPQSVPLFKEAIARDTSFAPAYAGVAAAYAYLSGTFDYTSELQGLLEEMRQSAERAIQLDPLLPEAYDALGLADAREGRWEHSEKSFRRSIELDPNRSISRDDYAMYLLLVLGRTKEALRQVQMAAAADPLSPETRQFLGYVLISSGRYDEAAASCEKLPRRMECLGRARLGQGRTGEAIQILATIGNRGYLGYAYAKAGRPDDAEKVAAEIAPNPFNQALVFAGLQDKERTLDALERMDVLGPVRIGRALTFPEFAFVRDDPRVKALRKRVGLP